jgi:hypothetical protein
MTQSFAYDAVDRVSYKLLEKARDTREEAADVN